MGEPDNKQVNGHIPLTLGQQLDLQLTQPIGLLLRGIMVSSPGVPPAEVVKSAARVTAVLLADAITGNLADVLNVRREIKEEFNKAILQVPVKQFQAPPANMKVTG